MTALSTARPIGHGRLPSSARQLVEPPIKAVGPTFIIFLLMIAATVTWRSKVYYSGSVDPVVLGKAGLSLLALVVAWLLRRRAVRPRAMGTRTLWFLIAFLAISTFGGWTAGEFQGSLVLSVRMLILALTVILLGRTFAPEQLVRDLLGAMLVVGLVGAISGVDGVLAGEGRLRGTLLPFHPNEIAMLCGLPAIGLAWLIFQRKAKPHHWVLLGGLLGIVWLTGSRTGLLALILAIGVMLLQARRLPPPVVLIVVAMIPVAAYTVFGTSLFQSYFDRGGSENVATLSSRTVAWSAAFTFPKTEWIRWMGSGLVQKKIPVEGQYWDVQGLDSSWISALVQAGILGMALLGLWSLSALVSSGRSARPKRMLFTAMLLFLLIRSILESGLLDSTPAFIMFMLVSVLAEKTSRMSDPTEQPAELVRKPALSRRSRRRALGRRTSKPQLTAPATAPLPSLVS